MRRKVFTSREVGIIVKASKEKKINIYSFFPCDKSNCECQPLVLKWKQDLAIMPSDKKEKLLTEKKVLDCPKKTKNYNKYEIVCKTCGQILGYCWASDQTLTDFFNFHYVQWTDGNEWYGCLTPNVSPITQQLTLECTCGADTRDFRANMTLSPETAMGMEKENSVGREFGKSSSKFGVRQAGK
jgi:hypothetical protein